MMLQRGQSAVLSLIYISTYDCLHWLSSWWLDTDRCVAIDCSSPSFVFYPDGGWVQRTPLESFIGQQAAGLSVLVTQQWVDKWVTGCLAVGQAFGEDTPVRVYGPWGEELYNSTAKKKGWKSHKILVQVLAPFERFCILSCYKHKI